MKLDQAMRVMVKNLKTEELIVTPQLELWMQQNPNLILDDEVADVIRSLLVAPVAVRSMRLSPSSAGQCHRRQVLGYHGAPGVSHGDSTLQNIFNDGTWRHLRWQATLLQAGIVDRVELKVGLKRYRSWGKADAWGTVPDDHPKPLWRGKDFGFELKGVGTFQFPKHETAGVKPDHLGQVARYMIFTGVDLWVIIYEDKGTSRWKEWVITRWDIEHYIEEQTAELTELNTHINNKTLPKRLPLCEQHKGDDYNACPYSGRAGACFKFKVKP